jgi:hypothetical protein
MSPSHTFAAALAEEELLTGTNELADAADPLHRNAGAVASPENLVVVDLDDADGLSDAAGMAHGLILGRNGRVLRADVSEESRQRVGERTW